MSATRRLLDDARDRALKLSEGAAAAREGAERIALRLRESITEVDRDTSRTVGYKTEERTRLRAAATDAIRAHRKLAERVAEQVAAINSETDIRTLARSARFFPAAKDYVTGTPDTGAEMLNALRGIEQRMALRDVPDDALPREIEHLARIEDVDQRLASLRLAEAEIERRALRDVEGLRVRGSLDSAFAQTEAALPQITSARKHLSTAASDVERVLLTADEIRTGSPPQRLQYLRAVPQMPLGEVGEAA